MTTAARLFLALLLLTPVALVAPGVSFAGFDPVEADARTVDWSTLRRLILQGGHFPPVYQPVSEAELAHLLAESMDQAMTGTATAYADDRELDRLRFQVDRYRSGGGGVVFHGCDCKVHPPQVRIAGRMLAGFTDLGDPLAQEAGLAWPPGWNAAFEPVVDFSAGPWWVALSARLTGRVKGAGVRFEGPGGPADPLTWPGWGVPTGKVPVRDARLAQGPWVMDVPRGEAGVQWGRWALSAGWAPRRTGPGLTGALVLDRNGPTFPAVTARRTRPFAWGGGFWDFLAPEDLLLRTGRLSKRQVRFREDDGVGEKTAHPWFFQWLVGWELTDWFRAAVSHTAMAAARDGSLWGDLLQINFPTKSTTWDEVGGGPVTDRILDVQFEFRWRQAPWPWLPAAAGRLYWDYAGTDALPSGPGGYVPQIAVPASVLGFELFSPAWDLGAEYAELVHEDVLWYSNSGFTEGYSHDAWVLGHNLGGSGESVTGVVRWRPRNRDVETGLTVSRATWGMAGRTPGSGERTTVAASLRNIPTLAETFGAEGGGRSPLLWDVTLEWNRESADGGAYLANPPAGLASERSWWRAYVKLGI